MLGFICCFNLRHHCTAATVCVQFLLITQVLLCVREADCYHTHLDCCGTPEKRNSDPSTCEKRHTCFYNCQTDSCTAEGFSQLPFCRMSAEDQSTLTDDQQHGGNNEDEEAVSKYFANVERVNSDVGTANPALETVDLNVNNVNTAAGKVDSVVNTDNTAVGKVDSVVDAVDPALATVDSNVNNVNTAAGKVTSKNTAVGKIDSVVDAVDPEEENIDLHGNSENTSAEKLDLDEDAVDPASGNVDLHVNVENTATGKVDSDLNNENTAAVKLDSDEDAVDPEEETVVSNVNSDNTAIGKVDSTVNSENTAIGKVDSNVNNENKVAEQVHSESDNGNSAAVLVDSNVEALDLTAGKIDAELHIDPKGNNICEEECPKEMCIELNDRLPETLENLELDHMIVQTDSPNEDLQTPESVNLEAAGCNAEQSLDTEDATQPMEDAEMFEQAPVQYAQRDFGSSESGSDLERDTSEKTGASPEFEEDDDAHSADKTNPSQGKWVNHSNKKGKRKQNRKKGGKSKLVKRFSDRDTENYRNGYPGKEDDPDLNDNVRFYKNEIPSTPDGDLIDDIHKHWKGNYQRLERHHGYIQWLFPIRESGMNWQAQPLQLHEAEAIKADPEASKRVLESYKLMLDFYGMELVDETTGKLQRSANYIECFDNLNWSTHNFLRITRILKCLGELGYEHLKKGFIQFVLEEALEHHTLEQTLNSCRDYWIGTIKNDQDREELYEFIDRFASKKFRAGVPDLVSKISSGYTGFIWAYTRFCLRLVFRLACIPISVFWWLFGVIFTPSDKEKHG